jgi:hypothetical protein
MARQTAGRRALVGLASIAAVAAAGLGASALQAWRPFDHGVDGPATWPVNIQPLVDCVEYTTDARFLTGDAFATAVGASGSVATGEADHDATGRAIGLWNGEPSKRIAGAGGRAASAFPAVWRSDDGDLVVRAVGARAGLSPRTRFTITALLTEVLQAQRFGVVDAVTRAPSMQAREALLMMSVGQAAWVGDRYLAALDRDETSKVIDEFAAAAEARGPVDAATPEVVLVSREVRRLGGEAFIAALHARDP